jgi:alpha-beta hydrolase superfamily lysophospholipase
MRGSNRSVRRVASILGSARSGAVSALHLLVGRLAPATWRRRPRSDLRQRARKRDAAKLPPDARGALNRYFEGSPVYPARFAQDWNRSYVLEPAGTPVGAVGAAARADRLALQPAPHRPALSRARLRRDRHPLPGHGTVPGGLTDVRWEDWMAATRLAVREARRRVPAPAPLHLVGFSNGGALAMKYALDAIEDPALPRADRIVLFADDRHHALRALRRPRRAAGAAAAVRQRGVAERRAGVQPVQVQLVPGQRRAAVVSADTMRCRRRSSAWRAPARLADLPPVLTFQSVIDFTVSTPAILTALYAHLPDNGSEIVLFDVNRTVKFGPLLRASSYNALDRLTPTTPQPTASPPSPTPATTATRPVESTIAPGQSAEQSGRSDLPYPAGIFSLSHLADPDPDDDPLYGERCRPAANGAHSWSMPTSCSASPPIRSFHTCSSASTRGSRPRRLRRAGPWRRAPSRGCAKRMRRPLRMRSRPRRPGPDRVASSGRMTRRTDARRHRALQGEGLRSSIVQGR